MLIKHNGQTVFLNNHFQGRYNNLKYDKNSNVKKRSMISCDVTMLYSTFELAITRKPESILTFYQS